MNVNITGHHVDVSPALREYIVSKLERINRHLDNVVGVTVKLQVDKLIQRAEATMQVSGQVLFAHHEAEDMYESIDLMADKLDRQVLRYKETLREGRHRAGGIKHQSLDEQD